MAQSAGWRAAPPSFLRWLRTSWIFLFPVRSFLCHSHRMDILCFHHRDIGILILLSFPSFLCLFPNMLGCRDHSFRWPYWPFRQNRFFLKGLKPPRGGLPFLFPDFPFPFLFLNLKFRPDTFLAMNASFSSRTQNVSSSLFDMNPSSPSSSSTQKPSSPSYSPCSMMKNVLLRLPP